MKLCRTINDCKDIVFSANQMQDSKFTVYFTYQNFPAPFASVDLCSDWLLGFCFGGKRTEAVYVMHKLIETKEATVLCRECRWPLNIQKIANLLIIYVNQYINEILVLRYSPYRLQPTRFQPSELYM